MTVEIKFNLPEDKDDYTLCMNGSEFYRVLWDLDQFLRSEIKYNDRGEYQPIRDKLHELMNDENINFNMVS